MEQMKSTADKLTRYGDALESWLKLKRKHDWNRTRPEPSNLKPLPPKPMPIKFELNPTDALVTKTHDHVFRNEVKTPQRKKYETK